MDQLNSHKSNETQDKSIDSNTNEWVTLTLNILNIVGVLLTIWALYWGFKTQLFTSEAALRSFLDNLGAAAPIGFIIIQIIQTVVPIIPGALTVPMGTIIFGLFNGFILNFIGIIIGSVINFLLARKYGRPLVEMIIGYKQYHRYEKYLEKNNRFEKFFTFMMFFPFSPDDIICYIAGLSSMTFKRYFLILLLGKPVSIFIYSYGIAKLLELLFHII